MRPSQPAPQKGTTQQTLGQKVGAKVPINPRFHNADCILSAREFGATLWQKVSDGYSRAAFFAARTSVNFDITVLRLAIPTALVKDTKLNLQQR